MLGGSGMAGHVISLFLREKGFSVDTLSSTNKLDASTFIINVSDVDKLTELLRKKHYDVVVNCIAVLVEQSESRKDLAAYLNSYLPRFLENYYKDKTTKIIHISTDDVFSYKAQEYTESSPYDGQTFYGLSKALGEIRNNKDLTFRMSIVGPSLKENGTGLFNWFWKQKGEIKGYKNAIWSGITTIELAKAIGAAIDADISGVYNLVPGVYISKYELLILFKSVFAREDISVVPVDGTYSRKVLLNTRGDFSYKVPGYEQMLLEMKDWITKHQDIYPHYGIKKT